MFDSTPVCISCKTQLGIFTQCKALRENPPIPFLEQKIQGRMAPLNFLSGKMGGLLHPEFVAGYQ
jgi:hypothetical protein